MTSIDQLLANVHTFYLYYTKFHNFKSIIFCPKISSIHILLLLLDINEHLGIKRCSFIQSFKKDFSFEMPPLVYQVLIRG